MANDEHVALLRQGRVAWNAWRERNGDNLAPDLIEAKLRGADLSGANLSYGDFNGANLIQAKLLHANLSHADLSEATLIEARLVHANLINAKLQFATLIGARLVHANLSGAFLHWADLSGADLAEANLSGANLVRANFRGANLAGANLRGAKVGGTIFGNVDLGKTIGLDNCEHDGPSVIHFLTLSRSSNLPICFLRGCGLPDNFIEYLPSLSAEAVQFYSCFISYSSKDQVLADKLHADLQNKGVRCWFAPHDLPIGAKTWDAIDEAIRVRDKLLVVLSEASIASDWVEDAVNTACAEERERKQTILFPIRVDDAVKTTPEPW